MGTDGEIRGSFDLEDIHQLVLRKQHLTENSKAERPRLVDVVKDICGLHAQVATTPYLSLWNRMEDFHKEDLFKELYERRTLVRLWGVRATVHIVPTDQVVEYYQATKEVGGRRFFKLTSVHKKILKILDERGPLAAQELADCIGELKKRVQTKYGEMSIGQLRLRELSQSAILVVAKPKGDWKSSLIPTRTFEHGCRESIWRR